MVSDLLAVHRWLDAEIAEAAEEVAAARKRLHPSGLGHALGREEALLSVHSMLTVHDVIGGRDE